MNNRIAKFVVFVFLAFYLPVILIWVHIISFEYRFHMLVVMAVIMAIYSLIAKRSLHDLGFRNDTLKASLLWNGGLSAFFVILMYSLYIAGLIREPTVSSQKSRVAPSNSPDKRGRTSPFPLWGKGVFWRD